MRIEFRFTAKRAVEIDAAQLFKPDEGFSADDVAQSISNAHQYQNGILWYRSVFSSHASINLNLVRTIRVIS